jgi:redox-sensitive bicupin YhaK (pirin superfamily)
MLDYNSKIDFAPSNVPRGVGVHPHRGFETVSTAYHGRVAHHDSYGNSGVIGEGRCAMDDSGLGVLHKEYHEAEYSNKGGPFHMVQLWVNLPAKDKMSTSQISGIN